MEMQRNVPAGPDPGLCGCDRDVFLRVWSRVMPEENEACPITVERPEQNDTAAPAVEGAADDFPTPDDVPCLGSAAADEQERLQEFINRELNHWQAYRALARRSGQGGRMLAALAGNCRKRAKRLSAALFLISGIRFWPAQPPVPPTPRSYFGALREQFLAEQNRGGEYRAAAEESRDACLRALYLDLADECAEHAACIRSLIENA